MLNGSHLENRHFYLCSVRHTTRSFISFSVENAVVTALFSYFNAFSLTHFIPVGFADFVRLFFSKFSCLSLKIFQLIRIFVLKIRD